MSDVKGILEQVEELLRQAANVTGAQSDELREKAMALLEQVKNQTQVLQDQAIQKAKEAGEATQEFVKDNPWKALGIAAGVGLLLGSMLKGGTQENTAKNTNSPSIDPQKLGRS